MEESHALVQAQGGFVRRCNGKTDHAATVGGQGGKRLTDQFVTQAGGAIAGVDANLGDVSDVGRDQARKGNAVKLAAAHVGRGIGGGGEEGAASGILYDVGQEPPGA
jgi:hypothetical protein